jgi:hypothetical protein
MVVSSRVRAVRRWSAHPGHRRCGGGQRAGRGVGVVVGAGDLAAVVDLLGGRRAGAGEPEGAVAAAQVPQEAEVGGADIATGAADDLAAVVDANR